MKPNHRRFQGDRGAEPLARAEGAVWGATLTTLARRDGRDPWQLYQEVGLEIRSDDGPLDRARLSSDTFEQAGRKSIQDVLDAAARPGHAPSKADVGTVSQWLVLTAAAQGLPIHGYRYVIDGSAVRHVRKNHGKPDR